MTVPILNTDAWREFRGAPPSPGINQTTHLAKIADGTGRLHDCFVKLTMPNTPALLCEAAGWLLAKASGVACPPFVAIVLLPLDELRKYMALPLEYNGMATYPAWCSEVVSGKSVRQIQTMGYAVAHQNCLRTKDARMIASFDQWSDLRDRNFGNVIQSTKGRCIAIDHETLLHDLVWTGVGEWEEWSLLEEASKALSPADFRRFQVDMAQAAIAHANALVASRADVAVVAEQLHPGHRLGQVIEQWLALRAQPGWMSDKLKVIV